MGTIPAGDIVDRAAQTLFDETKIQWTQAELLRHLSDAQRAAVLHLPEVNPVAETVRLAEGTRQTIPTDSYRLIDVVRNMGTDASTEVPGRSITGVDRATLDRRDRGGRRGNPLRLWHAIPPDTFPTDAERKAGHYDNGAYLPNGEAEGFGWPVKHFTHDTRDRRGFYTFPAQPQLEEKRQRVEIITAKAPEEITDAATAIGVDDAYQPVLLSYVLHRAYARDLPAAINGPARSALYFQQFIQTLTGQKEDDERVHELLVKLQGESD